MAKLKDLSDFLEIVQEVKNMVATPDYVEKASEQIKAVYALTEEENLKHNKALATIAEAKTVEAVLESLQKEHDEREAKVKAAELKLTEREDALVRNETAYLLKVEAVEDREAAVEKREKLCENREAKMIEDRAILESREADVIEREADVKAREDKIASFANNIA